MNRRLVYVKKSEVKMATGDLSISKYFWVKNELWKSMKVEHEVRRKRASHFLDFRVPPCWHLQNLDSCMILPLYMDSTFWVLSTVLKIFYLFLHSLRIILQFLGIQVVLCSSILFYSFVKCAKSWAVIQQYCSIANEVNYRWHPSSLNLNGLFMFLGRYLETERNIFTLRWGRPASCIFVLEYWLSWVIHGCKQKIHIDITHGQ
jgi:hypothetical protein